MSGNSHADQPTERGPGGEDRIGDCYVADPACKADTDNWHDVVFVGSLTRDIWQRIFWMASAGNASSAGEVDNENLQRLFGVYQEERV